jgi:hypothetical protein
MGPPPSRSLAFNAAAGDLNGEGHADRIAVALADAGQANRDRASNADARNRRRDPDSDSYTDGLSVAVAVAVTDTHRRAADHAAGHADAESQRGTVPPGAHLPARPVLVRGKPYP